MTVVPCPEAESIVTVPPCNSTNERTSDKPEAGPTMLRAHGIGLEPVEDLVHGLRWNARSAISHPEIDGIGVPLGDERHGLALAAKNRLHWKGD